MNSPNAADLWRRGDLPGAIAAQTAVVKAQPSDAEARSLLFALIVLTGDWDRAASHLRALAAADGEYQRAVAFHRALLTAEIHRQGVFEGEASPVVPEAAPAHVDHRLAALAAWRADDLDEAARRIDAAVAAQPPLAGEVDGEVFTAWRDLDDLLGSVCEVFSGGRYLWLPWEDIRELEVSPPTRLPDLVWLPARITTRDGEEIAAHLPTRYHGCADWSDASLQLGRGTDWLGEAGLQRGVGLRVLAWADAAGEVHERPLPELRRLTVSG